VSMELPSVITAFEVASVEPSAGKRHAAMRTGVVQDEGSAVAVSTQHQRSFEQRGFVQDVATKLVGGHRAVPEPEEHERVGELRLRLVGHGERAAYYRAGVE